METGRARILVVEDDAPLRRAIVRALEHAHYEVDAVGDGAMAGEAMQRIPFDLVLLDLGLPILDGWQLLAAREGRTLPPVIVISARGEERDKVRALDLGADDYLGKPFGSDELLARTRAVLRRARPAPEAASVVRSGDISVDLGARAVFRGGAEVRLTPTEYALLSELARHAGHIVDHRALLQRVWGPEYSGERNYLRTFVQRLRVKLEHDPAQPAVVVTAGRLGYRFGDVLVPATATSDPLTPR